MTVVQPKLLLVDDDVELAELMRGFLVPEGFVVSLAHSADGFRAAASGADLIVLDVMLPDASGFDLLREFRARSEAPVIMLTAKDNEVDRVVGLELGADDYMAKPFKPRELLARIRAVLRRTGVGERSEPAGEPDRWIVVGDVGLDPASRVAKCRDQRVDMTSAEFNLLELLLRRAGEIVGRDEMAYAAFGRRNGVKIDRNVDTLVSKLRRKLDPDGGIERRIKTVRNIGYIFARCADPDR